MNPKDKERLQRKIEEDSDFIYCPRLNNSMDSFIRTHPDGVDNERISKVLLVDEEEVRSIFESALRKIRKKLGLDIEEE
jgi:hypothetical protein